MGKLTSQGSGREDGMVSGLLIILERGMLWLGAVCIPGEGHVP